MYQSRHVVIENSQFKSYSYLSTWTNPKKSKFQPSAGLTSPRCSHTRFPSVSPSSSSYWVNTTKLIAPQSIFRTKSLLQVDRKEEIKRNLPPCCRRIWCRKNFISIQGNQSFLFQKNRRFNLFFQLATKEVPPTTSSIVPNDVKFSIPSAKSVNLPLFVIAEHIGSH